MKIYCTVCLILLFIFGESIAQTTKKMNTSILGIWSGKHITFEISEMEAIIDYDCAKGKIPKKITLNKNNYFSLIGEYTEEHGGPVRMNAEANTINAVYEGQISGKKMSLTVKRKDNNKLIGKFTLYFGREPYLVKCR